MNMENTPVINYKSRNLERHLYVGHRRPSPVADISNLATGRYTVLCLDPFDDIRHLRYRSFDIDVLEEDLLLKESKWNMFTGDPFGLEYFSGAYGFSVALQRTPHHASVDIVDYVQNTEAFYANMQRG